MAVIGQHPDSDGHDFELYNDQTYNLAQLVEYMYDVKWQNMATNSTPGFRVPGIYNKRDVDLDLFQWDGKYHQFSSSVVPTSWWLDFDWLI